MICLLRVCARSVLCVIAVCYVAGSGSFHGVVWCGLVFAWSGRVPCLLEALPVLAPRDRVIWSCDLVVWSGRTVTWSSVLLLLGSYRIVSYRIVFAWSCVPRCTLSARSGRDNITV